MIKNVYASQKLVTTCETFRLLCMRDNHGDVDSLERVVDETEGEEFDFVIHVGDITNAWFDSVDEGRERLDAVTPYFETLRERGELLYIWGIETEQSVRNSHSRTTTLRGRSSPKMTHVPLLERRSRKIPS